MFIVQLEETFSIHLTGHPYSWNTPGPVIKTIFGTMMMVFIISTLLTCETFLNSYYFHLTGRPYSRNAPVIKTIFGTMMIVFIVSTLLTCENFLHSLFPFDHPSL